MGIEKIFSGITKKLYKLPFGIKLIIAIAFDLSDMLITFLAAGAHTVPVIGNILSVIGNGAITFIQVAIFAPILWGMTQSPMGLLLFLGDQGADNIPFAQLLSASFPSATIVVLLLKAGWIK